MVKTVPYTLYIPESLVNWLNMAARVLDCSPSEYFAHIMLNYLESQEGREFALIVADLMRIQQKVPLHCAKIIDELIFSMDQLPSV